MMGPRGSERALLLCVTIVVRIVRAPTASAGGTGPLPPRFRSGFIIADAELVMHDVTTEPGVSSGTAGPGMTIDETDALIASNKVEGTAVYNREGEHLGTVYNFMVDKVTGQVAYAVMSFGGFLGLGQSYHPLPWRLLTYNTKVGGYVVDLDKDRLRDAPSFASGETLNWG